MFGVKNTSFVRGRILEAYLVCQKLANRGIIPSVAKPEPVESKLFRDLRLEP